MDDKVVYEVAEKEERCRIVLKSGFTIEVFSPVNDIVEIMRNGHALNVGESYILTSEIAAVLEE